LDPAAVWTDVAEFDRLANSSHEEGLRKALALAPAPLLQGFSLRDSPEFDEWLVATSELLGDRLAGVLARLTEADVQAGRLDAALVTARRWVAHDPLSEAAHREVMRLLTWTGERPAALRQFRSCVGALDRELGVAPLPETTALYDAIRANRLEPPPSADQPVAVENAADASPITSSASHASLSINLVGREPQLDRLTSLWREASVGGRAAAVVGAPGLGRTALAAELAARVGAAGGAVVSIRGHVGESGLAFAGVTDLVRSLTTLDASVGAALRIVGEPVETPGALIRLYDAVGAAASAALAGKVPGVLVVDDAHSLDPTSADLVAYLLRRPPSGVLVVATWRSDAQAPMAGPDLPETLVLRPLGATEVAAILSALGPAGLDDGQAHQRTGGVPRLVVEYALASAQGSASSSTQLRDLVSARMDDAPAATRQLLGTAAVLGLVADPELLRQTSGRDEAEVVEAVEDAVSRGLLVEDVGRGGYDVPYDSLRDLVLERMSLARRRLLHSRAADVLARRHATDRRSTPAALVAAHLAAGGRDAESAPWSWSAAMESCELYAHREALDHLRSALGLGFDPARAHRATGDVLLRLGRYQDATVAYEQAAAAIDPSDGLDLAVVEHKLAEVHERLGDWAVAQAHLESAEDLLEPGGPSPLRAQVCADLALVLHRQGRPEAGPVAREALGLAELSGDAAALAQAHNVLGVLAAGAGDHSDAAQHFELSRAHSAGLADVGAEVAVLNNLSRLHASEGHIDEALKAAQEALALGTQHGDLHRVAALHDHVADLLHEAGLEQEALGHLRSAAAAFAEVDDAQRRPEVWKLVTW
jgi:tetratricopeptide (TPR) repeat protein